MVIKHIWYFGLREHSGEIAGKFYVIPLFLVFGFFCVVEILPFCGMVCPFGILWTGRARHPGPGAASFAVEVFNVGVWLTHGDFVLNAEVDFLLLLNTS